MSNKRTKNVDASVKDKIFSLLESWENELTWDLLIDKLSKMYMLTYTRQALNKHDDIKLAFKNAKARLKTVAGENNVVMTPEMQILNAQVDKLSAQNSRLEAENQRLLEKFSTWLYNASARGLSEAYLNTPLPTVNRDVSKVQKVK